MLVTDALSKCSGIFGYINYLVEKDRKYIIQTLVNGSRCALQEAEIKWLIVPRSFAIGVQRV